MAEYETVQKGSLKLKCDSAIKKKKRKKKKDRDAKKILDQISIYDDVDQPGSSQKIDRRTKAEIAFAETRAKRDAEEILKKASKTHKDRIMEFNEHLDNLSEHFDIPKVSWTK